MSAAERAAASQTLREERQRLYDELQRDDILLIVPAEGLTEERLESRKRLLARIKEIDNDIICA